MGGGGGGVFVDKDCLSESCGIKFTLYFFTSGHGLQ